MEKIIRESAFDKKIKNPGLKFNPELALTGVRANGPRCVRLYEYVRISRQGFVRGYQGIIGCVCLYVKSLRNVVKRDMVITEKNKNITCMNRTS